MKSFARLSLCAGVAVVLGSALVLLLAKLGDQQTKDYLDLMKWSRILAVALQQSDQLDVRGEPVFRRTFEKQRITHELINRELTPREAIAQLRQLNEEVAETEPDPTLRPPLDEQSLWNNLIVAVRTELAANPRRAHELTTELERALNEEQAAGG